MKSNFEVESESSPMIQMSKEALAIFKRNVINNIGLQKSKHFFYHFGWELGAYDAMSIIEKDIPLIDKIRSGPQFHIQNGHISGYTSKQFHINKSQDGEVEDIFIKGVWKDSFEAKLSLELYGLSKECTCFISIGYTSGYLTKLCNREIILKETKCIAKGDTHCEFIAKNHEQWETRDLKTLGYFEQQPIVEELSETYDELLSQRQLINNVVAFQMRMMEKIINNNYLESILKLTYDTLKLPIIVENKNRELINFYGITDTEYDSLKEDFEKCLKAEGDTWQYISKMTHIQTRRQNRLVAPLIIEDVTLGYCSFIFDEADRQYVENYQLFFDSIINTVLLFLLNEKSKYESIDRMKSNFFDDILDQRYSKEDIISRGHYINIDFEMPYTILTLDFNNFNMSLKDEHTFISEVHDQIYKISKDVSFKYLITTRDNNFILYLQLDLDHSIGKLVEKLYKLLTKNKKYSNLKMAVSSTGEDVSNLTRYYDEACTALKLAIKDHISYFRDLGLIGIFINRSDKDLIITYAEEELGDLYKQQTSKNIELLRTTYYFLLSGCNYKETMSDLSISLTGLRYRISKVEAVLNKNLRNPNEGYHLLLLLKALIILNELDIKI